MPHIKALLFFFSFSWHCLTKQNKRQKATQKSARKTKRKKVKDYLRKVISGYRAFQSHRSYPLIS